MTSDNNAFDATGSGPVLADVSEDDLLARIFPVLASPEADAAVVPVGDDAAVAHAGDPLVVSTDTAVRGMDWRDDWSSAADVGAKVVMQNAADIAAMGGRCTGLLVSLMADPATPVAWVEELAAGIAQSAKRWSIPVLGGDLSGAPAGTVAISVTALGTLDGRAAVRRDGARAGDLLAVSGRLGRSGAGLTVLQDADRGVWPPQEAAPTAADLVGYHCRPMPDVSQGAIAAEAGASAMLDVSDGLVRDAGRIAKASGVVIRLDEGAVARMAEPMVPVLGAERARACVLSGGEEHVLLATFPGQVPAGWVTLGEVGPVDEQDAASAQPGVVLAGERLSGGGWDHFAG